MVFNSLHFLWFFLVVYALYRVLPHRGQNWLLLVASYYFYAAWDWRFLGLLVGVDARRLHVRPAPRADRRPRRRRRRCSCLSLGFNLTLLGFFKYFNFFADNLHAVFGALGWQLDFVTLRVLLPVGISFYTFVTMSYVIDVYRREIAADARPRRLRGLRRLLPAPGRRTDPARVAPAAADRIAPRTHHAASRCATARGSSPGGSSRRSSSPTIWRRWRTRCSSRARIHTGVNVLLGVYAFAFQIYGDFAGYSNIARGISKLMGIELIENFRFPYLVRIAAGILAPLAHQPVDLAARLPVHPARRQPRPRLADATQPADHDGPRRAVARRGVDVRAVGRFTRASC